MKKKCFRCFGVLSTKSRFDIFSRLKTNKGDVTVSTLVTMLKLRQPTVSFHVEELVKIGLVKKEKSGREVHLAAVKKCSDCPLFN
ncbi:hypothetical protein A2773_02145 [Candidatus Gottesmanbacteria bacterium RIFCSPHIGHO2_01_FULL_39_10]|uniref:HTH arsR-type domain-containing protein n=1 Tax=Candidatus Gottesmanbacteria bacterium RIFCSPHIGHO2_01_FULL_39_10 TaxID=1798375 RepID=A0A1F5ZQF3_9BACT|nr:MAG: hypothetical protein A2773_02145 [Candidatus Gottesmanbacteria bacterium RIFCSPHIGHO2_01_FULL_39_10]